MVCGGEGIDETFGGETDELMGCGGGGIDGNLDGGTDELMGRRNKRINWAED